MFCSICLTGCVSIYKPIQQEQLVFQQSNTSTRETQFKIDWEYDILTLSGNGRYADEETEAVLTPVSLLALSIENLSQEKLIFPDDFIISAVGKLRKPLSLKQAYRLLKLDQAGEANSGLEDALQGLTALNEWASNKEFKKDLQKYYLALKPIGPGEKVTGLLALRIRKGTELTFSRKGS
ncbi:MAG: hypothetical protein R2788_10720 [Saprospiraceae bacterium]